MDPSKQVTKAVSVSCPTPFQAVDNTHRNTKRQKQELRLAKPYTTSTLMEQRVALNTERSFSGEYVNQTVLATDTYASFLTTFLVWA